MFRASYEIKRPQQLPKKPPSRPHIVDKLGLYLSSRRHVDGLWVGTLGSPAEPILRRLEEALRLIERYDPLQYSRVIRNLERIWVHLLPNARACYQQSLKACIFDERFVLDEKTTLARIATAIIHEATHARLDGWGISYDEMSRSRIEAICLHRELAFARALPNSTELQEELVRTLEWYAVNPEYFSDASFAARDIQGHVETFRYLGTPDWLCRTLLKLGSVLVSAKQLIRRGTRHA